MPGSIRAGVSFRCRSRDEGFADGEIRQDPTVRGGERGGEEAGGEARGATA